MKNIFCVSQSYKNTRGDFGETRNSVGTRARVFPPNFSFLQNFHACFYNSKLSKL